MGKVFGEDFGNHPLDEDLDAFLLEGPASSLEDCLDRSVCMNIREDRSAPSRSRASFLDWREIQKKTHANAGLEHCLTQYHRVRVREGGEFLTYGEPCDPMNPGELLVRVFNLSGIFDSLDLFLRSPQFRAWPIVDRKVFNDFPNDCGGYTRWLSEQVTATTCERILDLTLKALAIQGEKSPYRPCWVTVWSHFSKRVGSGGDWWRVVGMKPPNTGDWLVLLAHPANDASPLYKPCQLYAGWYGFHYPAPAGAHCGYAMEILCEDETSPPLEEYIQGEIAPSLDHWKAAGAVRPWPADPAPYSQADHLNDRQAHLTRLQHMV